MLCEQRCITAINRIGAIGNRFLQRCRLHRDVLGKEARQRYMALRIAFAKTFGGEHFARDLNPDSLEILDARVEPGLARAEPGDTFQFERQGYFCADPDSNGEKPVFNRTVGLRDTFAKDIAKS